VPWRRTGCPGRRTDRQSRGSALRRRLRYGPRLRARRASGRGRPGRHPRGWPAVIHL